MRRSFLVATGALASLFIASTAAAADPPPPCDADAVLIRGSSASQKIIETIAQLLASSGPKVVYSSNGSSCGGGVHDMSINDVDSTPVSTGFATTANTSYDAAHPGATCSLGDLGRVADIGVSDVYASSCSSIITGLTVAADVVDTLGPVQAFTVSVHDNPSYPLAISSEAVFNTFGIIGRTNGDPSYAVEPWTNPAYVFGRPDTSGTWQTWARNVGLIPEKPVSTPKSGSGDVITALTATNDIAAIGIVALNDIVPNANTANPLVRPLAFKAKDQDFAYYTSSTSTATDMINVRDGHYQVWANLHFLAHKTGGQFATNVKTVLDLLEGKEATAAIAKVRAVPNCAMQVSRSTDGGDFTAYKPDQPCGCFFEATTSHTTPTGCKECGDNNSACNADTEQCVFGYCEAK